MHYFFPSTLSIGRPPIAARNRSKTETKQKSKQTHERINQRAISIEEEQKKRKTHSKKGNEPHALLNQTSSRMTFKAAAILAFVGLAGLAEAGQSFLREPFDQVAKVGEHVTLPCRVVDKQGVLQWTRDDFGLGSDRLLDGFKRYIMTGSDEEGRMEPRFEIGDTCVFPI